MVMKVVLDTNVNSLSDRFSHFNAGIYLFAR